MEFTSALVCRKVTKTAQIIFSFLKITGQLGSIYETPHQISLYTFLNRYLSWLAYQPFLIFYDFLPGTFLCALEVMFMGTLKVFQMYSISFCQLFDTLSMALGGNWELSYSYFGAAMSDSTQIDYYFFLYGVYFCFD